MIHFLLDTVRAVADRSPSGFARRVEMVNRLVHRLDRFRGLGSGWETAADEARAIIPFLPEREAVLFDLGVYHADWSEAALRAANARIKVIHGFEPSAENRARIAALALPKLRIVPCAVSSKKQRVPLYGDVHGSSMASLVQRDMSHHAAMHKPLAMTDTTTLDDYADEQGIDRIDFLKMDIEGCELEALHGAERLLARNAISGLSFEFGECNVDSRTYFRDFWKLLRPHGFTFYRFLSGARLLPIERYRADLEHFEIANYVALRNR